MKCDPIMPYRVDDRTFHVLNRVMNEMDLFHTTCEPLREGFAVVTFPENPSSGYSVFPTSSFIL